MNKKQQILAHLLEINVTNFKNTCQLTSDMNSEDKFIHIFASSVTAALDSLSVLGSLGITFDVSYSLEQQSKKETFLISAIDPIEIEIRAIPDTILCFEKL